MTINNLPQNLVPNAADLMVIWSAANADNRTLALADVAKHVVGTIADVRPDFILRTDFVARAPTLAPAVGRVINAAGYTYRYIGTGAVIADLPGWVPVEPATPAHWGALSDLAVDQSVAVEAAMAARVGGSLLFDKLYRSDGTNLYATHCYGAGPTTGIVSKAVKSYVGTLSGQHVINGEGVTGFSFRNMMFDNSENTRFASGLRTLSLYNCSEYVVDRCWFKTGGAAVASVNCSKYTVSNNTITTQTLYTVAGVPTTQHDGVIDQWWGSNNFTISNNTVRKGNVAGLWVILVTGNTAAPVVAAKCYNFKILNNSVTGFARAGIWAMGRLGGVEDFLIQGNDLNGLTDSLESGLVVTHANRFAVTNNNVYNTFRQGIRLAIEAGTVGPYEVQFGVVGGNVVSRVNAGVFTTSEGAAILIRDNFKQITIFPNVVQGTTHSYPLFVEGDGTTEGNLNIVGGAYPNGTMGGVIFNNSPVASGGLWFNDTGVLNVKADTTVVKGVIQVAQGTAAAPSISFELDPDTGFHNISANVLGASVGGVLQARLLAGEFAIIGATTETQSLRIGKDRTGDGQSTLAFVGDATNTAGATLLTRYGGVNGTFEIRHKGTGTVQIVAEGAAPFLMTQNGIETMRSLAGGLFAINAVVAATTLSLAGGATTTGLIKAVDIGTAGASGSTTTVQIGSAVAGALGTTTLNSPTVAFGATVTAINLPDAATFLVDNLDPTKKLQFQVSGIATATTQTLFAPNASGTMALVDAAQTFTGNTTFSNPFGYFGSSTATGDAFLGFGATINGATKTVRVGTGGVSGSTTSITIGSTFGTTTQINGTVTISTYFKATPTTVAGLVAAATAGAGARHFVTDALAPVFGSAVAGGGAVNVPVYSTGSAWNVG